MKDGTLFGVNHGKQLLQFYKRINIYDENNNLKYECFGDYSKICEESCLPACSLGDSYRNNGKPIYENLTNKSTITRLTNLGYYKFKGWYAKIIE